MSEFDEQLIGTIASLDTLSSDVSSNEPILGVFEEHSRLRSAIETPASGAVSNVFGQIAQQKTLASSVENVPSGYIPYVRPTRAQFPQTGYEGVLYITSTPPAVYIWKDNDYIRVSTGGLSAYEIAVGCGFVGTEQEWLASLQGVQGAQGIKGDKGDKVMLEIDSDGCIQMWYTDN